MTDQTEEQTPQVTATEPSPDHNLDETTTKMQNLTTSFSIWPPSQRTRDAVIKRLIETLTDKSVLSDRYGTVPADEAAGFARSIENEAFNAVPASPGTDGDDGVAILQSYSKEISKRMLDFVKSRSVESVNDGAPVDAASGDGGVKEEEGSTVEA
ncbi:putative WPP domain-containing protein [Helianthus annuus]|uniref:Putative WPP domain protein 1 n=1 Tax=Helianthus annuus TaxID=4232 RepID=A0A251URH2_HELAN|nr:MFP1 attachment factor 1 [Helianthus annuus]KAF5806405.1 putative WPP domain-containing protein [Helianthus annuus]KAJ0570676.1 putative WPP domain-containing protein/3 [Helianthus annuus]KAJ0577584.1 putative WPP domain-containing protein [Helianthus annuus]KAJ0585019.1 putative WPP domain-containing protein/3 [Helianthus annuus]KAJ0747578.1 putative WPP domain-containing protein/3 [Helianthus annuus]